MLSKNTPIAVQKAALAVAQQGITQLSKQRKAVRVLFRRTAAGRKQRTMTLYG